MKTSKAPLIGALFLLFVSCSSAYEARMTTTTVKVVDEGGEPIQGAGVAVAYSPLRGNDYVKGKGVTNADGIYRFSGIAYYQIFLSAEKKGYYQSRGDTLAYLLDDDEKMQPSDPVVELILKKIEDPVAMYARKQTVVLPKGTSRGSYDLVAADWVAPLGEGKIEDLIINIDSTLNKEDPYRDFETILTVSFSNEGDGLIPFYADERKGSFLRSPQSAPIEGYLSWKELRRASIPRVSGNGIDTAETVDTTENDINYLIRVRTVLDEDGEVEEALYGKIYGDFKFGGELSDKGFFISLGTRGYYLNPKINDNRLEFDLNKNLFDDVSVLEKPQLP